jgi:hypothetical protein
VDAAVRYTDGDPTGGCGLRIERCNVEKILKEEVSVSVLRRFVLAITCLALLPTFAGAQIGMLAGLSFENGKGQYSQGFLLQGSYTLRGTERVGVRFDVGVQTFPGNIRIQNFALPCRSPGCGTLSSGGESLTVLSGTTSLVLTKHLGAKNALYWIAGLGVYALNDKPTGRYTRFGWNAGGGLRLGRNVVAEVRYDGLVDPRASRGFVPIAVGFRF